MLYLTPLKIGCNFIDQPICGFERIIVLIICLFKLEFKIYSIS